MVANHDEFDRDHDADSAIEPSVPGPSEEDRDGRIERRISPSMSMVMGRIANSIASSNDWC